MHLPGTSSFVPLWLLTVIFFAALLAARELGAFLRIRQNLRKSRKAAATGVDEGDSFSTNTVLGLLALLIGFTFSLALGRYDERRWCCMRPTR